MIEVRTGSRPDTPRSCAAALRWRPKLNQAIMSEAKRFSRDIVWNLASVAILGICGVSFNPGQAR